MKYEKKHILVFCNSLGEAQSGKGENVATFDTPQLAKTFADTNFVKHNYFVDGHYSWKEQNNGDRFETKCKSTHPATTGKPCWFVIASVCHNPIIEEGD